MSQTGFTSDTFSVGNSTKSSVFTQINQSINDNDTRISALEGTTSRIRVMNDAVIGFIDQYAVTEIGSLQTFEAPVNMSLTTFQFTITDNVDNPGSTNLLIPAETSLSGILELTLEKYNESTQTWSSILSINPIIANGTAGRGTSSNNATFADADVDTGEFIRIRPLNFKDKQGSFHIQCTAEAR